MNGALSLLAAWLFYRFGIIAAVGLHFWVDVIWHVLYGVQAG